MEFIDTGGHIFSVGHAESPLGWESADSEYVFWINGAYTGPEISTGMYYVMQITPYIGKDNTLGTGCSSVPVTDVKEITVTCESSIFKVAGYEIGRDLSFDVSGGALAERSTSVVYTDGKLIIDGADGDCIAPFFVICKSDGEGTLMTNLLVSVKYVEGQAERTVYSVVRVGGVFTGESEKLEINAANFGKALPKGILRAVYQGDVPCGDGETLFDASLYNEKLKEYLMSRMKIVGETGNRNSMLSAFKWFGWGDKAEMSSLLKTDNRLMEQYVRDRFGTDSDIIDCFSRFRNTALVSFGLKENAIIYKKDDNGNEFAVTEPQKWGADFPGEGIPETEDLFLKYVKAEMNDSEFEYYEPYYLYNKATIMLKLYFFEYYYKKYFCPVNAGVVSASVEHRHIMQDYKMHTEAGCSIVETPVFNSDTCVVDIFGDSSYDMSGTKEHTAHFSAARHCVDGDFCEFSIYNKKEYCDSVKDTAKDANDINCRSQVYETHEMCLALPVRFWSCIEEKLGAASTDTCYIYSATIIISKKDGIFKEIYSVSKRFVQSEENRLENIIIIPRLIPAFRNRDIVWWTEGEYRIDIECNGRWFSQPFKIAVPEITADLGYLEYRYSDMFAPYLAAAGQGPVKNERCGKVMWEPSLVNVTNSDYITDLVQYSAGEPNINRYGETYNIPPPNLAPQYYNAVMYIDTDSEEDAEDASKSHAGDSNSPIPVAVYNLLRGADAGSPESFDWDPPRDELMKAVSIDVYTVHEETEDRKKCWCVLITRRTIGEIMNAAGEGAKPADVIDAYKNALSVCGVPNPAVYARFLVNRMAVVKCGGSNNVPQNSILCCSLYKREAGYDEADIEEAGETNVLTGQSAFLHESGYLPFKLDVVSSKWKFIPYSINIKETKTVTSKANTAIMGLQESRFDYMSGYYNIEVDYSLDGKTTQSFRIPYKIRIT